MSAWLSFAGVALTAIVAALGGYLIKRLDSKTAKTLTPYEALAKRVTDLEAADESKGKQIGALRVQLDVVTEDRDGVVAYLKTLWRWVVEGAKPPPPPIPDHLHDVLPPSDYAWPKPPVTFDDTTD